MTRDNSGSLRGDAMSALDYDTETGVLTWKKRAHLGPQWNAKNAGRPAGSTGPDGYIRITLNGRKFLAHRLAWLITTGEAPAEIDHINGVRSDNRLVNLRSASRAENSRNIGIRSDNSSGHKGVWFLKGKWRAQITINGQTKSLGAFTSAEAAGAAYEAAAMQHHGQFSNVGKSKT